MNRGADVLRIFNHIYLNDGLVSEALSAFEGGELGETEEIHRTGSEKGGSAELGAGPARLGGKVGGSSGSEVRFTRVDTPESRFARLVSILEDSKSLFLFDGATSEQDWYAARRGALIEAQGNVELSVFSALSEPLANLVQLTQAMTAFGASEEVEVPRETLTQAKLLSELTAGRPIPFSFFLDGQDQRRAVGQLDPQYLRTAPTKVAGDFTLFAKVSGFLAKGQTFDLTGVLTAVLELTESMGRQQRRSRTKKAKAAKTASFRADGQHIVEGPALKLLPYAIAI